MSSTRRSPRVELLVAAMRNLSDANLAFGQALADRVGVNLTDLKAASLLGTAGPLSAGRLAELTGLTTGAITGVLNRLERAGLVQRTKSDADRRSVIVHTKSERDAQVRALLQGLTAGVEAMSHGYTEAQLELVSEFLAKSAALMQSETERLRDVPHTATSQGLDEAPLGDLTRGALHLASGLSKLAIRGGAPAHLLYQAKRWGKRPALTVSGGTVTLGRSGRALELLERLSDTSKAGAELVLSAVIPWSIELRGGMSKVHAALGDLALESLEIRGGASQVEVDLPAPRGVVPLQIRGGASRLVITRPAGTAFGVSIHGGASRVSFDGRSLAAFDRRARLETAGAASAPNRYELEVHGGASHLTLREV